MSLLRDQDYVINHLRAVYLETCPDNMGERIIRPTHLYITKGGPRQLNWAASTLISKARSGSPPIPTDTFGDVAPLARRRRRTSHRQLDADEEVAKLRAQALAPSPEPPDATELEARPRAATVPSIHRSSAPGTPRHLGRMSSDNLRAAYKGVRPDFDLFDSNEDDTLTTVYEDTPTQRFVYAEYVDFDDDGLSGLSEEDDSDIEDEMAFAAQQIKHNASATNQSKLTSPRRRRRERRQRSLDLSPAIGKPRARTMSTRSGTSTELLSPQLPFVRQDTDSTASLSSNPALGNLATSNEERDRYIAEWSRNASSSTPSSSPSFGLLGPLPIKATAQVSRLTNQIRAKQSTFDNPLEQYIAASGKSEERPVRLKLYMPQSDRPREPWEVVVRKDVNVHMSIGFALYRYQEEGRKPGLTFEQCDANRWNLRIVEEDGEPDEDFPALERSRLISAYQFDEFALVEASEDQFKENERKTPNARKAKKQEPEEASVESAEPPAQVTIFVYKYPFNEMVSQVFWTNTVDTTTGVGDILDRVCKEMLLDQSMYAFKIAGTKVLVMNSMSVQMLQGETNLELTPRRVITQANGYAEPPTEKDLVATTSSAQQQQQQQQSVYTALAIRGAEAARLSNTSNNNSRGKGGRLSMATPGIVIPEILSTAGYQKYMIWRRQPMSFISRHERILAIDGEYIHIMPSEDRTFFDSPKTSSFHISQVIKCKQSSKVPANFKIVVRKTSGPKRYDLEAQSPAESAEIVSKIRSLAASYR